MKFANIEGDMSSVIFLLFSRMVAKQNAVLFGRES
jgi:hypothetical protein